MHAGVLDVYVMHCIINDGQDREDLDFDNMGIFILFTIYFGGPHLKCLFIEFVFIYSVF